MPLRRSEAERRGQRQRGAGAARPARQEARPSSRREGIAESVEQLLAEIQKALFDRALSFRNAHTFEPKDLQEFGVAVEQGFALSLVRRRQVRRANQGNDKVALCDVFQPNNRGERGRASSAERRPTR